jgi:hypothetical protein
LVKVTKNKTITCPVYLLFTEKVNFLMVNKEKNSQLKLVLRSWKKSKQTGQLIFCFVFGHFNQITKNKLMRYIRHKFIFLKNYKSNGLQKILYPVMSYEELLVRHALSSENWDKNSTYLKYGCFTFHLINWHGVCSEWGSLLSAKVKWDRNQVLLWQQSQWDYKTKPSECYKL